MSLLAERVSSSGSVLLEQRSCPDWIAHLDKCGVFLLSWSEERSSECLLCPGSSDRDTSDSRRTLEWLDLLHSCPELFFRSDIRCHLRRWCCCSTSYHEWHDSFHHPWACRPSLLKVKSTLKTPVLEKYFPKYHSFSTFWTAPLLLFDWRKQQRQRGTQCCGEELFPNNKFSIFFVSLARYYRISLFLNRFFVGMPL